MDLFRATSRWKNLFLHDRLKNLSIALKLQICKDFLQSAVIQRCVFEYFLYFLFRSTDNIVYCIVEVLLRIT